MSSFRSYVWDPSLLFSQMIALQSVFYSAHSIFMMAYSFTGYQPSVSHIFTIQPLRFMSFIQLMASTSVAVAISFLVQRTRQCLDFACTVHLFHLILVCIVNASFPTSLLWWLLQIISVTICTVLGEYLCTRIESREIKLSNSPSKYDL
ncbi:unnamed protein product, partial [Mesorhabditis belari]|uniref:Protein SYS1 homolog n=1 Tax=Mesorhabditis belari TaxID=2138241 RepID=A0AAF3F816_9BILA